MRSRFFLGLIIVALISIAGCGSAGDVGRLRSELPERGICAHRGAMATHPENTLSAFREAISLGAQMIEFDVRLTSDKELVIIHDATVDRTTDGTGKVSELTLAELKQLDAGCFKSPEFKGQRIPTLTEALEVMPRNIWLNVHLKGGKELGARVAQIVINDNRQHQAFLACRAEVARAARQVEPDILICNMERAASSWEYVNETITMKADFIQLQKPIKPEIREYTRKLKAHKIRINYYGTDSADELRQLFDAGVDFPLVNDVGRLIKVAEQLGIQL